VHDPFLVGGAERARHLRDDAGRSLPGDRSLGQLVGQRVGDQPLEHEVAHADPVRAGLLTEVDDFHRVAVGHEERRLHLAGEPHEARVVGLAGELGHHLDLHQRPALAVARGPHRAHRLVVEAAEDVVAAGQDAAGQIGGGRSHARR
jgi:hypothetical protein